MSERGEQPHPLSFCAKMCQTVLELITPPSYDPQSHSHRRRL